MTTPFANIKQFGLFFILLFAYLKLSASAWSGNLHFSLTSAHFLDANSVIIPFHSSGGLILVQGKVGESIGYFILDTGANGLVLNQRYFQPDVLLAAQTTNGIGGMIDEVGRKRLDQFGVEELVFENVRAETIDMEHIEIGKTIRIAGLIGFDILEDFEIMLNYKKRYLTFSRLNNNGEVIEALPHTQEKVDSFDFEYGNFIPVINVNIEGNTYKMGIDTGAELNLLSNRSKKRLLKHFKIIKRIKLLGANDGFSEAVAGRLTNVVLGTKYRCASMATLLTDMSHLNKIYNKKLDGILGYEFLAPWIFSINYKKKKLFLHKLKYYKP